MFPGVLTQVLLCDRCFEGVGTQGGGLDYGTPFKLAV